MSELLFLPERLKYRIFREPVRLNNDIKGLGTIVANYLGKSGKDEPIVHIFVNFKRNGVKLLFYDTYAVFVIKGVLYQGTFNLPAFEKNQKRVDIDSVTLMAMLQGLRLYTAKSA
jgi:hypothetical protein